MPRTTAFRLKKQIESSEQEQSLLNLNERENLSTTKHSSSDDEYSNRTDDNMERMSISPPIGEKVINNHCGWHQFDFIDSDSEDETINDTDVWFDAEDNSKSAEDDESMNNDIHNDDEATFLLSQRLCECTNTTRGEAVMMVLLLGAQHSLTWTAIIDILSMINTLFGTNVVPASKYKLLKNLSVPDDAVKYHLYCPECQQYIEERADLKIATPLSCTNCEETIPKSKISFFLTLNFRAQLQQLLENTEIQKFFESERNRQNRGVLEDIYDGHVYRKFSADNQPLANRYNLSYTFNSDGCQMSKSSRLAVWPIYAMIHQLPPKLRAKHIIMTGLWVSNVEPNMNLFFKPFVNEANSLSSEGIQWKLGKRQITSKIFPLNGCFDSVARCKILNMKQYNGYFGCTFCEQKGDYLNGIRYPISTTVPEDRTDRSIKIAMNEIISNPQAPSEIKGVLGPSILMNLEYFDLVDGMVPDYMHSILLGVVKQYTEIILTTVNAEFYVGSPTNLLRINQRLLSIKHPSCITRAPRSLQERNIWKASEWRSWLIFYSLICLDGILPAQYLKHLALLVSSVNIFLSKSITNEMIITADGQLIRFVTLFQEYFGERAMTYNIHLLLHMRTSVFNWGPLWTHNAFCFENENHFILQLRKSPTYVALQIARKYYLYKSLPTFGEKFIKGENFNKFCSSTLNGRLKYNFREGNCILIGNGSDYELSEVERNLIDLPSSCKKFTRMICNDIRYTSECYRRCEKKNDSIIQMRNGKLGIISNICYFLESRNIVIYYREILLNDDPFFMSTENVNITHIKKCSVTNIIQTCNPESLVQPGFLVEIRTNNLLFITIPQGCYGD
ncbi:uncharacterized protein [Chelonus insularis]|uniref:uncharacterized protein n=1 Tax=Chelonus insularis TaxID=460826 RepID=UPI00158E5696|nr:uncharacterized protein LOC118069623 [Chelonus insularis]